MMTEVHTAVINLSQVHQVTSKCFGGYHVTRLSLCSLPKGSGSSNTVLWHGLQVTLLKLRFILNLWCTCHESARKLKDIHACFGKQSASVMTFTCLCGGTAAEARGSSVGQTLSGRFRMWTHPEHKDCVHYVSENDWFSILVESQMVPALCATITRSSLKKRKEQFRRVRTEPNQKSYLAQRARGSSCATEQERWMCLSQKDQSGIATMHGWSTCKCFLSLMQQYSSKPEMKLEIRGVSTEFPSLRVFGYGNRTKFLFSAWRELYSCEWQHEAQKAFQKRVQTCTKIVKQWSSNAGNTTVIHCPQ